VTEGLVVVDKPAGWTSHDVVGRLRRLAGTRRVGHAGTLDPMATGVLVVGIGRATRLLGHLALTEKEYLATVRLGATTTTDDAEGDVIATVDAGAVDDAALGRALEHFRGTIEQVPSTVSAIKVDGVRAYARVRAGEDVQLAPRTVTISDLRLLDRRGDDVDVSVTCSSGTYVRALARDLGSELAVGGHLVALRRTRVGPYALSVARTLDQLAEHLEVQPLPEAVSATFGRRELSAEEAWRLAHGQRLAAVGSTGVVGAFAPDGTLVALLEERSGQAVPVVVFAPA
jgi:tRNA pseudouridine55 synthase